MGEQQVSRNQEESALILESHEVQTFITAFLLEKSVSSLKPTISFESGVAYPEASRFLPGRNSPEVKSFLARLANAGLLEKTLVDKLVACPSCKSTEVYSKYQCDRCKSLNISVVEILEHRLCGYSGARSNFFAGTERGGVLACPKCKQSLRNENDYRILGETFECASCHTRFETPKVVHSCNKCKRVFAYNEADSAPVFEYKPSSKMKEIFSSGQLSLNTVAEWLTSQGFRVDTQKEIVGTSKERHKFDVVASAGVMENLLLGDFSSVPDNKTIIAAFAKRYDVNQNAKSFIITYEKVPEAIEALAKTYGISTIIIDPQNPVSMSEQLSRMIGGTPPLIPSSSKILSPLAVRSRKPSEEIPRASRSITQKGEGDLLTIKSRSPKTQAFGGRKKKEKILKIVEKQNTHKKAEEKELRDYFFENDFTRESDDVYLSRLEEND